MNQLNHSFGTENAGRNNLVRTPFLSPVAQKTTSFARVDTPVVHHGTMNPPTQCLANMPRNERLRRAHQQVSNPNPNNMMDQQQQPQQPQGTSFTVEFSQAPKKGPPAHLLERLSKKTSVPKTARDSEMGDGDAPTAMATTTTTTTRRSTLAPSSSSKADERRRLSLKQTSIFTNRANTGTLTPPNNTRTTSSLDNGLQMDKDLDFETAHPPVFNVPQATANPQPSLDPPSLSQRFDSLKQNTAIQSSFGQSGSSSFGMTSQPSTSSFAFGQRDAMQNKENMPFSQPSNSFAANENKPPATFQFGNSNNTFAQPSQFPSFGESKPTSTFTVMEDPVEQPQMQQPSWSFGQQNPSSQNQNTFAFGSNNENQNWAHQQQMQQMQQQQMQEQSQQQMQQQQQWNQSQQQLQQQEQPQTQQWNIQPQVQQPQQEQPQVQQWEVQQDKPVSPIYPTLSQPAPCDLASWNLSVHSLHQEKIEFERQKMAQIEMLQKERAEIEMMKQMLQQQHMRMEQQMQAAAFSSVQTIPIGEVTLQSISTDDSTEDRIHEVEQKRIERRAIQRTEIVKSKRELNLLNVDKMSRANREKRREEREEEKKRSRAVLPANIFSPKADRKKPSIFGSPVTPNGARSTKAFELRMRMMNNQENASARSTKSLFSDLSTPVLKDSNRSDRSLRDMESPGMYSKRKQLAMEKSRQNAAAFSRKAVSNK